jgi:hypothetical protein
MKRIIACLVATMILLGMCGNMEAEKADASLDIALSTAEKLVQLVSTEYFTHLYSLNDEVELLIRSYGGDWAGNDRLISSKTMFVPKGLFVEVLSVLLNNSGVSPDLNQFSDFYVQSMATLPINLAADKLGINAVVVASLARYSEIHYLENMAPGVTYVLLDYGSDHPYIIVTFIVADDHAATINASFLMTDHESIEVLLKKYTTSKELLEHLLLN